MNDQPPRKPRVLVVGARHNSLGWHIAAHAAIAGVEALTAGITTEPIHMACSDEWAIRSRLSDIRPTHVVCTIGVNEGLPVYGDEWTDLAAEHMEVNFLRPMRLLRAFEDYLSGLPGTFVAISSNSARIARSSSAAYCASKAALSMGLRCAARDMTRAGNPLRVWGYEPGALAGTPMTKSVARGLGKNVPMSRMLTSPAGLPVGAVGRIVARDLLDSPEVLHGTIVPLDNGEQ